MKSNYQHIFTPLTVKNMTIKNRIVMMPMGTNYGEQNGEMSFLHRICTDAADSCRGQYEAE